MVCSTSAKFYAKYFTDAKFFSKERKRYSFLAFDYQFFNAVTSDDDFVSLIFFFQ